MHDLGAGRETTNTLRGGIALTQVEAGGDNLALFQLKPGLAVEQ